MPRTDAYAVAQIIKDVTKSFGGRSIRPSAFQKEVAKALAEHYGHKSSTFDRELFLIACGVHRRV